MKKETTTFIGLALYMTKSGIPEETLVKIYSAKPTKVVVFFFIPYSIGVRVILFPLDIYIYIQWESSVGPVRIGKQEGARTRKQYFMPNVSAVARPSSENEKYTRHMPLLRATEIAVSIRMVITRKPPQVSKQSVMTIYFDMPPRVTREML